MKRSVLVENSQAFAVTAEEAQSASKTDRMLRRRLEATRRRLIRSILGIAQLLTDDQLSLVAEYVLLMTCKRQHLPWEGAVISGCLPLDLYPRSWGLTWRGEPIVTNGCPTLINGVGAPTRGKRAAKRCTDRTGRWARR